jgi:acetolactate synthase-1/3 small subunit
LLRRRNFNIDSLQVGPSETPGISRMTFIVDGNERMVDQVIQQLRKVIDVTRVEDLSDHATVSRELALLRVSTHGTSRGEVMQIVDIYHGEIVDVTLESVVIQIVGSEEEVDGLISLMEHFGIQEMVRTGRVALARGVSEPTRLRRTTTVWRAHANGHSSEEVRQKTGGV